MAVAVIAEIGAAAWVIAAEAAHAIIDGAALVRLIGDDGAENQTADNAGSHRAAIVATITPIAAAIPASVLNRRDKRIVSACGLRQHRFRQTTA